MTNFKIIFSNPWFLLLLLPAIAVTVIPYLRLNKRYRRNRNRIISMTLHSLVFLFAISVFAGISFSYRVPNDLNEIILVVDVSDTEKEVASVRDEYVANILNENYSDFKVGVVTFGYDQVLAVPLGTDASAYMKYIDAEKPDASATDVSAALTYAKSLLKKPETGKIVLISDGLETDENAMTVIKSLTATGLKVDTLCVQDVNEKPEVQIVDVKTYDSRYDASKVYSIDITLQSNFAGYAAVLLVDNDNLEKAEMSYNIPVINGKQTFTLAHTFDSAAFHKLSFQVIATEDTLNENNAYCSYIYLEEFSKILILERTNGESENYKNILANDASFSIATKNIENAPATLEELRNYDEVVLFNIANADMPKGFSQILQRYVKEIGGGLLTVGGNKDEGGDKVANAYDRSDMLKTTYQDMLPVKAVDFTPPIGVVLLIDSSGSMSGSVDYTTNKNYLELAQDGAVACLSALNKQDWVGIMTFKDEAFEQSSMIPLTHVKELQNAIASIGSDGGATLFEPAFKAAAQTLQALTVVEKKHIILVTDGEPNDGFERYSDEVKHLKELGITLSIITVNATADAKALMDQTIKLVDPTKSAINVSNMATLPDVMRNTLNVPEIKVYNPEKFTPRISNITDEALAFYDAATKTWSVPEVGGFYGTEAKEGATVILASEYAPLYAKWNYGEGKVGSFMSDLYGTADSWSSDFMNAESGAEFLRKTVINLLPKDNIRGSDMLLTVKEDNYTTDFSVSTTLEENESLEVEITDMQKDAESPEIFTLKAVNGYGAFKIENKEHGVYKVVVNKIDEEGNVISSATHYKCFSYSKEYDGFVDIETGATLMKDLAEANGGKIIENPADVYEGLQRYLVKTYDPKTVLAIISICLFILDIAVRKFKFKWIHEIIRERKNKTVQ